MRHHRWQYITKKYNVINIVNIYDPIPTILLTSPIPFYNHLMRGKSLLYIMNSQPPTLSNIYSSFPRSVAKYEIQPLPHMMDRTMIDVVLPINLCSHPHTKMTLSSTLTKFCHFKLTPLPWNS